MSNRTLLGLSLTFSMISALSSASFASPIDGYSDKALEQNKTLLQSVIKIETGSFFNAAACTSTLIAKNILLTAKHCAENLAPGQSITLNGDSQYEVVEALMPEDAMANDTVSDIALIMFESCSCKTSKLANVNPIPLAYDMIKSKLSNQVLIAGYGKTSPEDDKYGALRAGYNEWILSDYSDTKKMEDYKLPTLFALKKMGLPLNMLFMASGRMDMYAYSNTKGEKISNEGIALPRKDEANGAVPLPGDSGGPAIAFDEKGNPYVVGVTSMAAPSGLPGPDHVALIDTAGIAAAKEPLWSTEIQETEEANKNSITKRTALSSAMRELSQKIVELGYADSSNNVLKDFAVIRVQARLSFGMYASLLNHTNAVFMAKGLSNLERKRDAANYCQ